MAYKVQFANHITDRFGQDVTEPDPQVPGTTRPVTLGHICNMVLDTKFQKVDADEPISKVQERWGLIGRITKGEKDFSPVELTAKEVSLLQDRIALAGFSTSVTGRALEMLEGEAPNDEIPF